MIRWLTFALLSIALLSACSTVEPTAAVPTEPVPTATADPTPTSSPGPQPTQPPTATPTLAVTASPVPIDPSPTPLGPFQIENALLFPGPVVYEGDLMSVEIPVGNLFAFEDSQATVSIDGAEPVTIAAQQRVHVLYQATVLVLKDIYDTTGQAGEHELSVQAAMGEGVRIDITFPFEVRPASERPSQETNAEWLVNSIDCCELHYLSGTAAERDIEQIAQMAQDSFQHVEELLGEAQNAQKFKIIFIDNVWGNGGYASEEGLVISYPDRNYAPTRDESLEVGLRHEISHLLAGSFSTNNQVAGFIGEGLPVYIAGGHYKEEPIPERMAALYELGYYVPVANLSENFGDIQHEARYLESAATVAYLVETYGWEGLSRFFNVRLDGDNAGYPPAWLEGAVQQAFGISLEQFEADFLAWVQSHDPGDQVQDLNLTIQLQDVRRAYQFNQALASTLFLYSPLTEPNRVSLVMREPDTPENVAIEAMIINAQQAILEGRYDEAERMVMALRAAVYGRDLSGEIVSAYLKIAQRLASEPYEVEDINLDGDQADVLVSGEQAGLQTVQLREQADEWEIEP